MQKILNNPKDVVEEMLQGYLKCHPNLVEKTNNPRVFVRKDKIRKEKVGIVSGGGTGHFPAFIGYVKPGMLDAVAVGNVFVAPDASVFLDAFRAADYGKGVLCIYGNYKLDNESVTEAIRLAELEGIQVKKVVANDDIAIGNSQDRSKNRGLAGEVLLWKLAGAASEMGMKLEEITEICQRAIDSTRSIGIGLSACIIPEVGAPNFDVIEGTMEFGIGHHGDPGMQTYKLRKANKIADLMMSEILKGYEFEKEDEVAVLVSGLGATPQMELYILFNRISDILKGRKINVFRSYVGNYFTSLDMNGASVTLLKLDQQIKTLLTYKEENCL
jgi:dihydroxyacetone kinase-like protein